MCKVAPENFPRRVARQFIDQRDFHRNLEIREVLAAVTDQVLLGCHPVGDHAGDDKIRIVEGRTIGMHQRIAKLAALVDGARRLGAAWLGMPPGKENCRNSAFRPASFSPISG